MCTACELDPRDRIAEGERALGGLRHILALVPPGSDIEAESVAVIVSLIHERMHGAAEEVQGFVPRDWTPPA